MMWEDWSIWCEIWHNNRKQDNLLSFYQKKKKPIKLQHYEILEPITTKTTVKNDTNLRMDSNHVLSYCLDKQIKQNIFT